MSHERIRMLYIEDDLVDQMAFKRFIQSQEPSYDYDLVSSVKEAREALRSKQFDIIVADFLLSDGTSFDFLGDCGDTPFIVVTGTGNEETAVEAMKRGARDYLIKDPHGKYLAVLPSTVRNVLARHEAETELKRYRENLEALVQQRTTELSMANAALVGEIDERKRTEEKLKSTLQEKTSLLREVHHRVKNNLQVMISLMQMAGRQVVDAKARQLFLRMQTQARAMSLVYEQLYQSESLARVHMPTYLSQLAAYVLQVFGATDKVELNMDVEEVTLDVEQATPCGLIVNELVSNVLKHAFPREFTERQSIRVGLKRDGNRYVLTVTDNGKGLPDGFDLATTASMGLHLVYMWATHQMGGSCAVNSAQGAEYTITFESLP